MQKITHELKLNTGGLLEFMVLKIMAGQTLSAEEIFDALKVSGFRTPMGSLYPLLKAFRRKRSENILSLERWPTTLGRPKERLEAVERSYRGFMR